MSNLHSLDELLLTVRDNESKRLCHEAITAYNAGAYRSAILSIWVAVCADLISKIRELSRGGDAAASAEVAELDKWISSKELKKLQSFESGLIELAKNKFEFFLEHESIDLLRLREDRHLCAHPAFVSDDALFSPTPELVRAHIAHAIIHCLSRPPVQGKQLVARYDRDLLGGSFPKSAEEVEVVLRQNYLERAKVGAIVSIIRALAKALTGAEAQKYAGKEEQIAISLAAIGRISPAIFEEHLPSLIGSLGRELDDSKIVTICRYVEWEPRIWHWLGEAGRARILAKIDNATYQEIKPAVRARHVAVVGGRFLERTLKEDLNREEGKGLSNREVVLTRFPCAAFVDEALTFYSESKNFATAEKRGADILLGYAKYFVSKDIQRLDNIIRENEYDQILNAAKTSTILTQLFKRIGKSTLPDAMMHWSKIASYIAERNMVEEYAYQEFFQELQNAGVEVPVISTNKQKTV